jgi:Ca2+-binding RTX toxin-like protein
MARFVGTSADDIFRGTSNSDRFIMVGGGQDTVFGKHGNDFFLFDGGFTAQDSVFGGGGAQDTLKLSGDYSAGLTLAATTLSGIEKITFASHNSYTLVSDDANVAAGRQLTIDGSELKGSDVVNFDGSAETDGVFVLRGGSGEDIMTGGEGADTLIGGVGIDLLAGEGGADTFLYNSVAESTNEDYDTLDEFNVHRDYIDLDVTVTGLDSSLTTGSLSDGPTYVSDFETAIDDTILAANHAVVWTPDAGADAGDTYLVIDANGIAGFQSGQDYIIELEDAKHLADLDLGTFI